MKSAKAKAGAVAVSKANAQKAKPPQKKVKGGKKTAKPVLAFPGVPKKRADPVVFKNFKIYTDVNTKAWRVLKSGDRADARCSWSADPQEAWAKVCRLIS